MSQRADNIHVPNNFLSSSYAVFGLGSTAYEHFCAYGKRLDELLLNLGGTRKVLS